MRLGKIGKEKQFLKARHSSGKSVVFSCFGDIGRTICTIDVRIILKARNNSGKSVVFLCFETLNPQSENFVEVVNKTIGTFSSDRQNRSTLFEAISKTIVTFWSHQYLTFGWSVNLLCFIDRQLRTPLKLIMNFHFCNSYAVEMKISIRN